MRIGSFSLLFIIFLILKLTHHINWSWVWVFSPLWIPVSLALVIGAIAAISAIIKT